MSEHNVMNTAFYEVFKTKLDKQKSRLKEELKLAKTDRRKDWIKSEIKDAKRMRDLLKKMEKQMGKLTNSPHCGKEL